ncbi:hypothetical protein XCR1_1000007 [Xenorhabdus cabanillasii JM26]|uniref:Uncharacterized protein n=1 Tax=Xenorhabdus cabanillasii JM26 TaxID=1427517 RepID=W1IMX2_9GAMM|nr:hypothetical protein XCR1_1000007 [Xenorhabdus cabanillasii JM26]
MPGSAGDWHPDEQYAEPADFTRLGDDPHSGTGAGLKSGGTETQRGGRQNPVGAL